jgi:hypothetical protein
MPVNIGIVYTAGGILGWSAAKVLRLPLYLQPVMTAFCSAGLCEFMKFYYGCYFIFSPESRTCHLFHYGTLSVYRSKKLIKANRS